MSNSYTEPAVNSSTFGGRDGFAWDTAKAVGKSSPGMKTILVVDDNPLSRELIRDALDSRGYEVIEAEDGEKALRQIREHSPDLVIMDIQMPVMDGYTAINQIRSDPRLADLPVLAVTAYAMLGDREKAIAAGFRGYMSKPINVTTLRTQIDALLR